LIILLGIVSLFSGNLQAQNNPIYFPYVTNNAQTSTELILTNASGTDANVSLVAYADDGTAVAEVSVTVGARTQVVVGPGTFIGLQGWFSLPVTSPELLETYASAPAMDPLRKLQTRRNPMRRSFCHLRPKPPTVLPK
jgi:hypothetical protein